MLAEVTDDRQADILRQAEPYRQQLAEIMSVKQQEAFMQIVARHWRLQQALINGHSSFSQQAEDAKAALESLVATND